MEHGTIPDIVVGRLPRYLQSLQALLESGIKTTSSQELGEILHISPAQIRKDLSQFGGFGKQGTGYNIQYLINQLEQILNIQCCWDIVLVGIGDLGHALARYQGFTNRGFRIVMAFDTDPNKIGQTIGDLTIEDMTTLPDRIYTQNVRIAMLTVPAPAAQQVAEELVQAGIQAILNYAPITLRLPAEIRVENIDPITRLQHMTYYLRKD